MSETIIKIDGIDYVPAPTPSDDIRIVVLQRGWVFVGRFSQDGPNCQLRNAHNIRQWGTTRGLGEIADGGPTPTTVLDACPMVEFHELTVVCSVRCFAEKWQSVLGG